MRLSSRLLKPLFGAALCACAASASAQEAAAPAMPTPLEAATKAELMAQAGGRVAVYLDSEGLPYGEEYFNPNGREVVWRYLDGSCQTASWTARGTLFCFAYPDSTSCWRVRAGGPDEEWTAHLVEPAADQGLWVRMVAFENRKLHCAPDLVSMAAP